MNPILKLVKSVFGKPKKAEVETEVDISLKYLTEAEEFFDNNWMDKHVKFSKEWGVVDKPLVKAILETDLSVKINPNHAFIDIGGPLIENIIQNGLFVANEIKRMGGQTVVMSGMSARTANMMGAVSHLTYLADWFTEYVDGMQLFSIFVDFEDEEGSPTEQEVNEIIASLKSKINDVSSLIGVYAEKPEVFKAKVNALSNEALETMDEAQSLSSNYSLVPVIRNDFSYNPIFFARSWAGSRQTKKILLLEEKKKLLETRRMYLQKLMDDGQGDSIIERDLKIFEKRIEEMQAEIDAFERDIA